MPMFSLFAHPARAVALMAAAVVLLMLAAGDAAASHCRCGGGGSSRRGGPVVRLVQHVRERAQERREARSPADAFPAPAAVAGAPAVTGSSCANGTCVPLIPFGTLPTGR
jgi:hypothetical protein